MVFVTEGFDSDSLDGGKLYRSFLIRGTIHISYRDWVDKSSKGQAVPFSVVVVNDNAFCTTIKQCSCADFPSRFSAY